MDKDAAEASAAQGLPDAATCPICSRQVPEAELPSHVDECLMAQEGTTPRSPGEAAAGQHGSECRPEAHPVQWAEMTRCELDSLVHQGLAGHHLQDLETALEGFVARIQEAREAQGAESANQQ
eukprot:TRINITY_DN3219_c0_g1_i4.p2 TRINITY_DN3219_c0_g1~~TRINITY_DN3219_c0_g1_i4.p2  ORF type:complete len:123 (+),score=24.75 TRINITY_DN3219_c0_g1_i4:188-556(+)